jgi:hypothetical protein
VLDLASRQKVKSNVIKGVFVGYDVLSTAYKVFFPDTGKVRVYRDVIVNETPPLTNLKLRHMRLPEELEEWPQESA